MNKLTLTTFFAHNDSVMRVKSMIGGRSPDVESMYAQPYVLSFVRMLCAYLSLLWVRPAGSFVLAVCKTRGIPTPQRLAHPAVGSGCEALVHFKGVLLCKSIFHRAQQRQMALCRIIPISTISHSLPKVYSFNKILTRCLKSILTFSKPVYSIYKPVYPVLSKLLQMDSRIAMNMVYQTLYQQHRLLNSWLQLVAISLMFRVSCRF